MRTEYRDRKRRPRQDFADKAARQALEDFRRGSQINGGCAEVYAAVAAAIRHAANAGHDDGGIDEDNGQRAANRAGRR